MGIVRRSPEENRRRRIARQRNQIRRNQVTEVLQEQIPLVPKSISKWTDISWYKRWNIIPIDKFKNKGLYYSMSFEYKSFAYRYTHFQNFLLFFGTQQPRTLSDSVIAMREEAKEKYFLNQKLRFAFKRLFVAYLLKKMKLKNEVDPITLEPPKECITLYDHFNRSTFQFEAKELLRDFQSRLLTHDDLFPLPQKLRNPLTNTHLTLGQILSLYAQILSFGYSHWSLECFRDADFKLKLFSRDNQRKLRLHALKDILKTPSTTYFLLDFIEAQHDVFKKLFDVRTYRWALENNKCQSMERIRSWKTMCYAFYEIELTEEDFFEKQNKQKRLRPLLEELCSPCRELQLAKRSCRISRQD
jgi:hypothetical protein